MRFTDRAECPKRVKYAIFGNKITSDSADYAVMVQISGSADGDVLVEDIVDQRSAVNTPDILAVTDSPKLTCPRRVERGSLDRLCGFMNFGETVSVVRWATVAGSGRAPRKCSY